MIIKREVAYGIVRGLSEFWKSKELQDFTVTVGSTQFGCHKFLLAACSGFFRGLFRSGMKETELKCANIKDMTNKTFELILEAMYTGCGVLTNDNVIDIWRAANQLQIVFLIEECETFVIHSLSLENFEEYFYCAKLLSCQHVLKAVVNFMKTNFVTLTKTRTFLEFTAEELMFIVKSQDLRVSHEDVVVESILRWIDYENQLSDQQFVRVHTPDNGQCPNDRNTNSSENSAEDDEVDSVTKASKDNTTLFREKIRRSEHLASLFSAARMHIASLECLHRALKHPKVRNNHISRDIVLEALLFNTQAGQRNGQWPSSAIYRNGQEFENVGISCVADANHKLTKICAFSFSQNKWFELISLPEKKACYYPKIVNINALLHIFSQYDEKLYRHYLTVKNWEINVCLFDEGDMIRYTPESLLTAVTDKYLYIFKPQLYKFQRVDLSTNKMDRLNVSFGATSNISLIASYSNQIFFFYSELTGDARTETAVHCYDTVLETWTRLNSLEGPAEKLTSFKNDRDTFILQINGSLWKVVQPQSDVVDFELVVKLWSHDWPLLGAVTYMNDLYVLGLSCESHRSDPYLKDGLAGIFDRIIYLESETTGQTTFVPAVVSRKHLM